MSELPETYETEAPESNSDRESKADEVASLLLGGDDTSDSTQAAAPAPREQSIEGGADNPSDDLLLAAAAEVAADKNMNKVDDPKEAEPDPEPMQQAQQQAAPPEYAHLESQAQELNQALQEIDYLAQTGQIDQHQYNMARGNAQQMFNRIQQDAQVIGMQQAQQNLDSQRQQFIQQQQTQIQVNDLVNEFPELRTAQGQQQALQDAGDFLRSKGMSDQEIAGITGVKQQRLIYIQMKAEQSLKENKAKAAVRKLKSKKRATSADQLAKFAGGQAFSSPQINQAEAVDRIAGLLSGL